MSYLTSDEKQQYDRYGTLLTGDEDALSLAKLERTNYLKHKFRQKLEALIGDYGDNITDATRAIVLGEAIRLGLVTDATVIAGYKAYISWMLEGYGGAKAILTVLGTVSGALQQELVAGYYKAKAGIGAAQTVDEVRLVDLPGEPVMDELP